MTRKDDRVRGIVEFDGIQGEVHESECVAVAAVTSDIADGSYAADHLVEMAPPGTHLEGHEPLVPYHPNAPWYETTWKSRLRNAGAVACVLLFVGIVWYCAVTAWHTLFP